MTREEAIKKLKSFCHNCSKYPQCVNTDRECFEALDMAIRALKNEQTDGDLISRKVVLDVIDAEAWAFCDYLIREGRNDEQQPVSHFSDNLRERIREELPTIPQTDSVLEDIKAEIEKEIISGDSIDYINGLNMALMIINEKHISGKEE